MLMQTEMQTIQYDMIEEFNMDKQVQGT